MRAARLFIQTFGSCDHDHVFQAYEQRKFGANILSSLVEVSVFDFYQWHKIRLTI